MMKGPESFARWNVEFETASRPRVRDRDQDSVRRLMPQEEDLQTVHGPVAEFAIPLGGAADGHDFFPSVAARIAACHHMSAQTHREHHRSGAGLCLCGQPPS
jgi:hypothetical protein